MLSNVMVSPNSNAQSAWLGGSQANLATDTSMQSGVGVSERFGKGKKSKIKSHGKV